MDMKPLHEGSQLSLWQDLVVEGEEKIHTKLSESAESYLVFVLMRHMRDGALAGRTLALEWFQAVEQVGRRRPDYLRDVGDRCLLIAGMYPKLAERRHVTADYYADLGRGAYLGVAESARDGYAELFAELARAYRAMVRVLAALAHSGTLLLEPVLVRVDPVPVMKRWH